MIKYLFALMMLVLGAGAAHACNVPNPNLSPGTPPTVAFVDGCAVPAVALNAAINGAAKVSGAVGLDARLYGATCGTSDSTSGIQAVLNAAATLGGTALIPCPMTVATGNITIPGGVRFWGNGPGSGNVGQSDIPGPAVWPPTTVGSAINCTSTSNPCFIPNGQAIDVGYLVVGNPEGVPPSTGSYIPTVYPYIFSTSCGSSWQSLHMHDMTFVSTYDGIDLEGCSNYSTNNSGGTTVIERVWFNVVLNVGIRAHLIDYTPLRIRDIEGWSEWYYNVASLGAYVRGNLKFFDIEYCAACMISGVETPPAKYGIWFDNGTVNNPGAVTLAYTGLMDHMNFQNSCQAMAATNTSLSLWLNLSNSIIWGDQSSFQCSSNLPMISLPSNLVYLGINNMDATSIDTLLAVGCGTPGVGACPGGANGGSAYVRLSDAFVNTYATVTSAAPLIKIPNTTLLSMQNTDPLQLIPFSGHTGKLFAAGFDGTTGCMRPLQIGGGINPSYGSVTVSDSCGLSAGNSGQLQFFDNTNTNVGGVAGNGSGMNYTAHNGPLFLYGNNSGTTGLSVGATGSTLNLLAAGIPTIGALTKLGTVCVATTGAFYYAATTC